MRCKHDRVESVCIDCAIPKRPLTADELQALREAEAAATPGEWFIDGEHGGVVDARDADGDAIMVADCSDSWVAQEFDNAHLIALARNAMPRLLEDNARLREALSIAAGYCEEAVDVLVAAQWKEDEVDEREARERIHNWRRLATPAGGGG